MLPLIVIQPVIGEDMRLLLEEIEGAVGSIIPQFSWQSHFAGAVWGEWQLLDRTISVFQTRHVPWPLSPPLILRPANCALSRSAKLSGITTSRLLWKEGNGLAHLSYPVMFCCVIEFPPWRVRSWHGMTGKKRAASSIPRARGAVAARAVTCCSRASSGH
jgi:hypothetical protein